MSKWTITQRVDYYAEDIEADTEEEALAIYLKNQEMYYNGVWSESITKMEEEDED